MNEILNGIEFWHWWVLAALLMAIEVFAPTTVFLWTGISAATVGFVVLAADGIGWPPPTATFWTTNWRIHAPIGRPPSAPCAD